MTVTCPSCHASLTVPDERLPKGKLVAATCPRCKGPIQIDTREAVPPATPPAQPPAQPPATSSQPAAPVAPRAYGEQRQPRALICADGLQDQAQLLDMMKEAGYQVQVAADAADAAERLRFTPHAVAVIRDGFGGAGEERSPLLDSIAEMGTGMRRHLCVILLSDRLPALDPMVAFAQSVDVIIHPNDLAHLPDALQRSLEGNERKYHVLKESLRAANKA